VLVREDVARRMEGSTGRNSSHGLLLDREVPNGEDEGAEYWTEKALGRGKPSSYSVRRTAPKAEQAECLTEPHGTSE
jgi:hypothetical protein